MDIEYLYNRFLIEKEEADLYGVKFCTIFINIEDSYLKDVFMGYMKIRHPNYLVQFYQSGSIFSNQKGIGFYRVEWDINTNFAVRESRKLEEPIVESEKEKENNIIDIFSYNRKEKPEKTKLEIQAERNYRKKKREEEKRKKKNKQIMDKYKKG